MGAGLMAVPTKASEMIEVMRRNTYSVNDYVRGKLTKVMAGFTAGEAEPYFIANRAGAVTGVILSIEDLRSVVQILESLQSAKELEEERLAVLAERRAGEPVVAGLDEVFRRYGADPEQVKKIIPELEFE